VHGILEFLGLIPDSTNVYTFTTTLLHSSWLADRPKLNWDLQPEFVIVENLSHFQRQVFYACVYCSMYNVLYGRKLREPEMGTDYRAIFKL
jgi:hypothetical protein